ncbi:MAG: hypothetical protein MJE77_43620 [Proteobacteria bacterium]|nr:hypothetical protein [Pseudomonadota bacterium]
MKKWHYYKKLHILLIFVAAAIVNCSPSGTDNGGVVMLPPLGDGVSTLVGSAEPGQVDGARDIARFNNPTNLIVESSGTILVADFDNGSLRRVTPEGDVTTLTHQTGFSRPFGLVSSDDGTLYVQTDANEAGQSIGTGTIWRIDTSSGAADMVATDLGRPRGIAELPDSTLILADYLNHTVSILDPSQATPARQLLAGAENTSAHTDATGAEARFDSPWDLVVDGAGDVFISDRLNHCIRRITSAGVVTTLAGNGTVGTVDGPLLDAQFNEPAALAIDDAGIIYVADNGGYVVRKIDVANNVVTTIAGDGTPGYLDHEDPLQAQFFGMEGMDVVPDGSFLYIADGNRGSDIGERFHRIRRLKLQ